MMTIEQKLAIITTMGNAEGWDTDEELAGIQQVKNKLECTCEQLNEATSALGDILANEQLVIINAENFFLANNIEDIRKALNKTITKLDRYNEALETNKEAIDKYIHLHLTKSKNKSK
ncbi:hypothetical protein AG2_179 [Listeria phage vB_LmoM_AG20]|uniref:Uncharacterized protein n=1 Tax=Listeria phage vB_LmoM_AG20 TaxID=1168744 RepID=M4H144_9CAUD|nr:hypothetical protein AG2_179 [Listeria phage vB_LmoM_AG20]AFJ76114.1 hypothetical protein AG2_179 [Listeria phage vB_LmoM_AG20]WIW77414.1 hypothetical protein CKA15_203 [Listeria phage cka15]